LRQDLLQPVRGMRDLMPDEAWRLRFIEGNARRIAELYGYEEVITPVIEHYDLLAAKIGEENRKRMYVFEDLGGRKVALRPEFTASIARLVTSKMAASPKPIRLFSFGSLYRYDEPQMGRYREFWQANYELIGSKKPEADAEILSLTNDFFRLLGIKNYFVKINHVGILRGIFGSEGVAEEGQNAVMQMLDKRDWEGALSLARDLGASEKCLKTLRDLIEIRGEDRNEILERISEAVKGCQEAIDALNNFKEAIDLIEAGDVKIRMYFEAGFARGLEYYTGIIFEVYVPELNIAVGGGGRYDRLIEVFGGSEIPAVGVAFGVDRIMLAMEEQGINVSRPIGGRVLVVPADRVVLAEAFKVAVMLRENGIPSEVDVMGRSLSRSLSDAGRRSITHVVIVGRKELSEGKVVLRDMRSKIQEEVKVEELPKRIYFGLSPNVS